MNDGYVNAILKYWYAEASAQEIFEDLAYESGDKDLARKLTHRIADLSEEELEQFEQEHAALHAAFMAEINYNEDELDGFNDEEGANDEEN